LVTFFRILSSGEKPPRSSDLLRFVRVVRWSSRIIALAIDEAPTYYVVRNEPYHDARGP
jgi:hypothetical protein